MALPRLTIPPLFPNNKRLVHKYRRAVGRGRTDQLQKIVSIFSGDLSPLRIRRIRCWAARPQRVHATSNGSRTFVCRMEHISPAIKGRPAALPIEHSGAVVATPILCELQTDDGWDCARLRAPRRKSRTACKRLATIKVAHHPALSQLYLNEWTFFDSADLAESCHNRSKPNSDC